MTTAKSSLLWELIQTTFHSATGQCIKIPQILKRLVRNCLWPSFLLLWVFIHQSVIREQKSCVLLAHFPHFFGSIQVQLFCREAQPPKDCSKDSLRGCCTEKLAHTQLSREFLKALRCFRFQPQPSAMQWQVNTPWNQAQQERFLVLWHLYQGEILTASWLKYFSIFSCFQKGSVWG